MTPETTDLVAALTILKRQIPAVCLAMTQGQLSHDKQTEFGDLLIQLGELVQQHAPAPIIDGQTEPPQQEPPKPARVQIEPKPQLGPAQNRRSA